MSDHHTGSLQGHSIEHALATDGLPTGKSGRMARYIKEFTKTYLSFSERQIERRELACLNVQFPFILQEMQDGDLFVGRINHALIGFSPQMGGGFGYYLMEKEFAALMEQPELDVERANLRVIYEFWRANQTAATVRQAYPPKMQALLPSDNWNGESGIGFPLYRMSGSNLDYEKLVRLGIGGLLRELEGLINHPNSPELYDTLHGALELLSKVCLWYAERVEAIRIKAPGSDQARLNQIISSLKHIAFAPPQTLHQALQLFWLYALLSGNVDYGRFDITFVDIFKSEIERGTLSDREALAMLSSLWRLMNEREGGIWMFDSRVIIGGRGRRQETFADRFALLCIEATRRTRQIMPQLTLRFYQGQEPLLYQKALDCIAENNPYPMLYNDDVNVPAVSRAFRVSPAEAPHYVPFGCGEYVLEHRSFGTPSGVINMLQALLVTLRRGIDPTTNRPQGLPMGHQHFETFEDLYNSYCQEIEAFVDILAEQEALEYRIAAQTAPFLFFTLLFDDCVERGQALFDGGIRYLGGTLETYGNSNTADSLLAIKRLVYEQKLFSLAQLVAMLDADFAGHEQERRLMEQVAKYGNDNDEADAMLVKINRHVCEYARAQARRVGLHSYLVVVINNNANTVMGRYTAASPDGRRAFTPMNNGNAPSSGMDRNGVTAFLNSIVKPPTDIHAGAVQNMKFSRELFTEHRQQVEALLSVYWENGGAQAMLNVIARNELEDALIHPERYANLIVRVGGYSARFIDLAPDIQQEILARTLY